MVSVIDPTDEAVWGCEAHAAQALDAIADTRINQVCDWDAARRLPSLRLEPQGQDRAVSAPLPQRASQSAG